MYKHLYIVKDGTHNDTWYMGGDDYIRELKKFLKEASKRERMKSGEQTKILE